MILKNSVNHITQRVCFNDWSINESKCLYRVSYLFTFQIPTEPIIDAARDLTQSNWVFQLQNEAKINTVK